MSDESSETSENISENEPGPAKQIIDPMMLGAIICPKTRTPLTYDRSASELISKKAKLAYPIREGVPIMLVEEARDITKD